MYDDFDTDDFDGDDAEMDAADDINDLDSPDADGLDAESPGAPPDPFTAPDTAEAHFSGTTTFPDGSTVTDPHTDALGNVYPSTEDWIGGTNKHEVGDDGTVSPVA